MSISKIGAESPSIYFIPSTKNADSLSRHRDHAGKINSPAEDSPNPEKISEQAAFKKSDAINPSINLAAQSIKAADKVMERIETYIDGMKAQLERIVKNYPPFPPGSEERVKILKSISSLRKEIDQLTIPPPDDKALKIVVDPAVIPQARTSEEGEETDGFPKTIRSQEVQIGSTSLNIPTLSESATDVEIEGALQNLQRAKETLAKKREGLIANR
jgi:hypothetical protein